MDEKMAERFSFSSKRRTAPAFCFYATADGKPLRTFPGVAPVRGRLVSFGRHGNKKRPGFPGRLHVDASSALR
ncbi:hypothetical protein EHI44_24720 [Rhizobium leguminosarum]|nr:hypothetical protein EHI44_24720 [Rhizobium leguminosarum]